jgi:MoxR-like ATPase
MDAVLAEVQRQVDASAAAAAATAAPLPSSSSSSSAAPAARRALLRRKIQHAIEAMGQGLVERDTEVRLLLLAALAREHVLFIGPPGTAKSEVGRRLARLVAPADAGGAGGATYFERLLTRFSVPEELFGPLSMRALEEDRYVRQTRGYLPEADVAFVDGESGRDLRARARRSPLRAPWPSILPADPRSPAPPAPNHNHPLIEIFKANSAILNALLTLLNERLFDNGSARVRVPLISMVGASNELPESEELDALYDRFLLRREVGQVSAGGLAAMLEYYAGNGGVSGGATPGGAGAAADGGASSRSLGGAASPEAAGPDTPSSSSPAPTSAPVTFDPALRLTRDDFDAVRGEAARAVRVPASVIQLLADLRAFLQERCEPPVYVSDRRLVKAVALMQVAAYCDGRDSVSEYDCLLLEHVLWQRAGEARRVGEWVLGQLAADDGVRQVQYLMSGVFGRACKVLGGALDVGANASGGGRGGALAEIAGEAGALRELLAERLATVTVALDGGFPAVLGNLWLGADEAEAVATALVPKLQRTKQAVTSLLFEAATLEVALRGGADAVALANLMPRHWADFIRNAPADVVEPIGLVRKGGGKI